jgi:hypothetical protein
MKDISLPQFLLGTIPDEASETAVAVGSAFVDELRAKGSPIIQRLSSLDSDSL